MGASSLASHYATASGALPEKNAGVSDTAPHATFLPVRYSCGVLTRAILRRPGPEFAAGLTTARLGKPDLSRMQSQHAAYADALRALGLEIELLDPLPGFPDAYFVEDVAVVVPELFLPPL